VKTLQQTADKYNPFGGTISSSGSLASANTYRFSSKEYHSNPGLYYYGYRLYDPNLQRWLNRDPIEENGRNNNLYSFNQNNPITKVDSFGLLTIAPLPGFDARFRSCLDSCAQQYKNTIDRCRQMWGPKPNSGFGTKCLAYTVGQILDTICDTVALSAMDKCLTSCTFRPFFL
jgi:RHS repeat-associated protein